MMTIEQFSNLVVDAMGVTPTTQQRALIDALARFCGLSQSLSAFVINGYAGTGKTSVIAALVKALTAVGRKTVLLAPTGRAAKVLSNFAGQPAMTIHRKIYSHDPTGFAASAAVAGVADNPLNGAIFIVDEASMIGDGDGATGSGSLLDDLLQYVYSGNDCRLILLGDTAQLPPVGCSESPAMSVERLRAIGLKVSHATLTATVRQHSDSGILYNATRLRRGMLLEQLKVPRLRAKPFADVKVIEGEDLQDDLASDFGRYGIDGTILITRSNKRAMEYNLAIRRAILEKEEVLSVGEPVLVSKNNYYWTSQLPKGRGRGDFIANGDVAIVNRIYGFENRQFLRFADVELTFPYRDLTFDAKLILNSLDADTAGLNPEHEQMLIDQTIHGVDPAVLADPWARARLLHSNPYFNALRVKYAYAVTCHKAQGGQWESVYVDMGGIAPDALTTLDFQRWLYTAITRAHTKLTLVNPTFEIN